MTQIRWHFYPPSNLFIVFSGLEMDETIASFDTYAEMKIFLRGLDEGIKMKAPLYIQEVK